MFGKNIHLSSDRFDRIFTNRVVGPWWFCYKRIYPKIIFWINSRNTAHSFQNFLNDAPASPRKLLKAICSHFWKFLLKSISGKIRKAEFLFAKISLASEMKRIMHFSLIFHNLESNNNQRNARFLRKSYNEKNKIKFLRKFNQQSLLT